MEDKIKMIAAASEALSFIKENSESEEEPIFQYVSDFISSSRDKIEESVKFKMIAAVSETIKLSRKRPRMTDKEILKEIMNKIPIIIAEINQVNKNDKEISVESFND